MCKDSELMKKAKDTALELAEYILQKRYGSNLPELSDPGVLIEYGAHMFLLGVLLNKRENERIEELKRKLGATTEQSTDYYIPPLNDR